MKKNAILLKLFWYKVFVHWKLKLLNSLMDFFLSSRKPEMKSHSPLKQSWLLLVVVFFNNRRPVTRHYTTWILCLRLHYNVVRATVKANNNTQVFLHSQHLFVDWQAPASGHLTLTKCYTSSGRIREPFWWATYSSQGHLFLVPRVPSYQSFHCILFTVWYLL